MKKQRNNWRKYWQLLNLQLSSYGVYRLNFILWRVRAVLSLLVIYFLWWTVSSGQAEIFDYSRAQILTYVLGVAIIRSFVLASPAAENVGEQVVTGEIVNWLLKPVGYLRVTAVRDMAGKLLNVGFSIIEIGVLVWLLRPPLVWQGNAGYLVGFVATVVLGMGLYFILNYTLSLLSFWTPEDWWSPRFVFLIILEFLAGGLFPIDILPAPVYQGLMLTPFPYLLFFPMQVYLGKVAPILIIKGLVVTTVWIGIIFYLRRWVWRWGLRNYSAWGR